MLKPTGLAWIDKAAGYIGEQEIKGGKHNPLIIDWWKAIGASWFKDDETPWCGAFVGGVLAEVGIKPLPGGKGASARAWNEFGVKLLKPAVGCIVIFSRNGGGHVGFVVGKDQKGNLMVLGGNQADGVNIKPFATSRVLGYRWPSVFPAESRFNLPVITSDGRLSTNEA
ncbi:TIGR02594 family protein [Shinella zoogloeoides]|uniref:TIGR02594 family protein n=1 Tax=Shinella zoogloeoides TaxID=352475 RepID=UPI00273D7CBB|nr:TIGR02594 family protein [Shinella zoogloeoides]WLR91016.1 TIGR02594 family protein [Shinella zoogloeoides]